MAGFDAIAHAVETAVTARRTPMSDTFSHQAWRLLNGAFERVLQDEQGRRFVVDTENIRHVTAEKNRGTERRAQAPGGSCRYS